MPIKFLGGLLLFILYNLSPAWAQDTIHNSKDTILISQEADNEAIKQRNFNKNSLDKLKKQREYIYDREVLPPNPTLWEQFLEWIRQLFRATLDTPEKRNAWQWGLYIFSALAVIFLILRLLKVDIAIWFKSDAEKAAEISFQALSENIHTIDFDKLIQESVYKNNFRQAVRLYYLKSLKKMNDAKLIEWEKDKTNRDYYYELKPNFRNSFQNITWWFEYVCYGEFHLDKMSFQQASDSFKRFEEEIGKNV